jgi:hypothetical protein
MLHGKEHEIIYIFKLSERLDVKRETEGTFWQFNWCSPKRLIGVRTDRTKVDLDQAVGVAKSFYSWIRFCLFAFPKQTVFPSLSLLMNEKQICDYINVKNYTHPPCYRPVLCRELWDISQWEYACGISEDHIVPGHCHFSTKSPL